MFQNLQDLFLNKRIVHFSGMPKNYILGVKGMANSDQSNLFFAFFVEYSNENPRMNYVENAGRNMFVRYDLKADANYREATEMVLYAPA